MQYGLDSLSGENIEFDGTSKHADFYIGRLGGETKANNTYFSAPSYLSVVDTFSYWDLAGNVDGSVQANAYLERVHGTRVNPDVVFFDIEPANGGWVYDHQINRPVLEFAVSTIHKNSPGTKVGLYISEDNYQGLFGDVTQNFSNADLLWLAGTSCPDTYGEVKDAFPRLPKIAGMSPTIWQFHVSGCGGSAADINVAINHHWWGKKSMVVRERTARDNVPLAKSFSTEAVKMTDQLVAFEKQYIDKLTLTELQSIRMLVGTLKLCR